MKSRFTYGMFAGFALACLFFFFFLFFFPNVFRTLTAKNPQNYPNPVAMTEYPVYYDGEYVSYSIPTDPGAAPAQPNGYGPEVYTAYSPDADYTPEYYDGADALRPPYGLEPDSIAYSYPDGDDPYNQSASTQPPEGLS